MNWLNRLDNALEEALTPNPSRHGRPSNDDLSERRQQLGADLQKALNDLHEDSSSSKSDGEQDKTPRRRTGSSSNISPEAPETARSHSPMLPGRLTRQKTPFNKRRSTGSSLPGSFKRTSSKNVKTVPLKHLEQQHQLSPIQTPRALHDPLSEHGPSPKSDSTTGNMVLERQVLERIPASARPPRPIRSKRELKQQQQRQEDELDPPSKVTDAADFDLEEIPLNESVLTHDELLGKSITKKESPSDATNDVLYTPPKVTNAVEQIPAAPAVDELDRSRHESSVVSELSTSLSTTTPNRVYPGTVRRSGRARPPPREQPSRENDTESTQSVRGGSTELEKKTYSTNEKLSLDERHPSKDETDHSQILISAYQLPTGEQVATKKSRPHCERVETAGPAVSETKLLPTDETNGYAANISIQTEHSYLPNSEKGSSSSENLSFESAVSSRSDDNGEGKVVRSTSAKDMPSVHPTQVVESQVTKLTDGQATLCLPVQTAVESTKEFNGLAEGASHKQRTPLLEDNNMSDDKEKRNVDTDAEPRGDVPRQVLYRSEFDAESLSGLWGPDQKDVGFDNSMNCRGTVHVRILRAQRLPCSVGSTVQAVVSLIPWKGRVHTPKTTAFFGPSDENGVCAKWDEDETRPILMVHSYSDLESPVPRIGVDLKFVPLGMFGFTMSTLELDCEFLLMNPHQATRKWFSTDLVSPSEPSEDDPQSRLDRIPLIEIEAMFEPDAEGLDAISRNLQSGIVDYVQELGTGGSLLLEGSSSAVISRKSVVTPTGQSDELSLPTFSLGDSSQKRLNTRPHLLQLTTFRTPASCLVCKRSIMSSLWKKKAFRCEACSIDCCSDCRLQVDLQLPCGSEAAKQAVASAIQHRFTMESLMSVVAPVSEEYAKLGGTSSEKAVVGGVEGGVGVLKIEFLRSYVLAESDFFSPESDPSEVFRNKKDATFHPGDYYMRATRVGSTDTVRTETIQNSGKPRFDSGELRLRVPHYGSDFRIELVDATTDNTIGTTIVPAQSLLQRQRDFVIETEGASFLRYIQKPLVFKGKIRLELELRHDMKNSSAMDFFSPHKSFPVAGCAEVMIGLEESLENLFGKGPYVCPPRPPDGLDMNVFQNHLKRIGVLIDDLKSAVRTYQYIVSWENPLVTALAFFLFVQWCIRFNPAYLGSLPAFAIIMTMLLFGVRRFHGMQRKRFIEKEARSVRQAESVTVAYMLHRPIGRIGVMVDRARNLRSAELGLPGNAGCQLYWDPTRLMTEAEKRMWVNVDAASAAHSIGSTAYVYSANPTWDYIKESEGTKRICSLLSSNIDVFEAPSVCRKNEVIFPVLQPYNVFQGDVFSLEPWNASRGALVVEVKFSDLLKVVGSEYSLGEVCVPLSDLCIQNELSGWFHVSTDDYSNHLSPASGDDGTPQLHLNIRWLPPKVSLRPVCDIERESSIVLQEEMIRSAILGREQKGGLPGSTLVGSSFGALQTVRGISGYLQMVQNYVGMAVDFVEAARNAFNFTDPWKSTVILACVATLWLFFSVVPLRIILFAIGVVQFVSTFFARFGRLLFGRSENPKGDVSSPIDTNEPKQKDGGSSRTNPLQNEEGTDSNHSPVLVWLMNAFHGLPTEEDLRRTYFWESRRFALHEAETIVNEKRKKRLRNLWGAEWYASVLMLCSGKHTADLSWAARFAIVQGHRLLWWDSVSDFDAGNSPSGRILLAGHAGLSTPSPLELRKINKAELDRIVTLFGRGAKTTILLPSVGQKIELERAVENALTSKRD